MTRNSFVCILKVVFLFIAAFTLTASAQETGSVPDYDRPWQHFAQSGPAEAQGPPVSDQQSDELVFASPAKVSFLPAVPYTTTGYNPYSVAIADVNGDG